MTLEKVKINKRGIFAARAIKKGEVVLEWNPKILSEAEVEKLESDQKHYIVKAGEDMYLLMKPPERYVNHSCEPNTMVFKNNSDVAVRDIKKGEEITSDYGGNGMVSFRCGCGSKNCKGTIN